jgi:type II secretory pathway component PulC
MFLKRYFWAINLALITLFIWASVDLFFAFLSAKLDQRPLPRLSASTDVPPEPDKKPRAYFAMLTTQNVFDPFGEGHLKLPEVAAQQAYVPPPPPPLSTQLRLKGTVAGGPDFGIAIVDDLQSHRQEVVKLGGRIRNAQLLAVTRTGVVFDVGGRQETLALLEKDVGPLPAPGGPVGGVGRGLERPVPGSFRRGPVSPTGPTPVGGPAAPEAEVVRPLGASRFAVNRQKANQMAAQPGDLSGQGKLGAGNGGLTLNDLPPGGLAEKAGLQSGDVLKRINGEPVTSPAQALQAYQKALSSPAVKLEVERSRRPLTLTYELR